MSVSKPSIKVASISFSKNEVLKMELLNQFPETVFNSEGQRFDENSLVDFIGDSEAVVIGNEPVTEKVLSACPQLKTISKYGVGLDNIDEAACKMHNVDIGWTGGVNRRSVAELTLYFMLALCRNAFHSGQALKQGRWEKDGGTQLTGKTIGIIGVGHIGKEVIRLLSPFDCRILVNDIVDQSAFYQQNKLEEVDKRTLYKQADITSLHVPLTDQTRRLIDQSALGQMKTSAFLINTSRGEVVQQEDLKQALKSGQLAGAGLDVFQMEPPEDPEFLELPGLVGTPHIGGNSKEAVLAMGRSAIKHLTTFFP